MTNTVSPERLKQIRLARGLSLEEVLHPGIQAELPIEAFPVETMR